MDGEQPGGEIRSRNSSHPDGINICKEEAIFVSGKDQLFQQVPIYVGLVHIYT